MTPVLHDLRYALRSLAKARGFAAVAILTLACALGANTAIFSVVSAILLQPLPFTQPQELMWITGANQRWSDGPFSWPNYFDLAKQTKTLEHVGGYADVSAFLYQGGEPDRLRGSVFTASVWPILGVPPLLGRTFNAQEDAPGQPLVVVISYDTWQKYFGGDPKIVGRVTRFGTKPRTIVGVMPRGFNFPMQSDRTEFWMPLSEDLEPGGGGRGAIWMNVVGRLRDGVSIQQAAAELNTISARLDVQYPASNKGLRFRLEPLHSFMVRNVRPALIVLMCAVAVVLLIGCANVANLLLARAAVRHKEISIRSALGATRSRILFQLLVESVVLSMIAGAVGLLLAAWGVDLLVALAPPEIPRLDAITIDRTVLLFTLALSVLTGIIFGLAPALSASKTNLVEALKEGSRGSTEGRRRNRIRNLLVTGEVALSVFLLVGAGLLLRSFLRLSGVDPGYEYHNAIAIDLAIRSTTYPKDENVAQYHRRAMEELSAIPGVTAVGGANHLPLGNNEEVYTFDIVGRPPFLQGQEPNATFVRVTPNYFHAMGIPILRGRPITAEDTKNAPKAVVVSESFARQFFKNEDPTGKRVDVSDGGGIRTIVGVARDIHFVSLTEPPKLTFYVAAMQGEGRRMQYVVRAPNASTLGPSLRAAVRKLDREQPILGVHTLEQMRSESLASRRFMLVLIGVLAALALILAGVGIYSIMSYTVTQRTSEIGIRMSLGAEARDIFRLIVGQSVRLVAIGLGVGIVIALAATRVMTTLLFGITATDPLTFASICVVIGGIALVASYIPANRATKVDPLVAIRYD
jgi:putative ABC transport system permease protein